MIEVDHYQPALRLPVPAALGRALVLASVFVCAACGLVYELELVAMASYLVGDSVTQTSIVLSVMVFAMGAGSLIAKRMRCKAAVGFALVEAALALIGGLSAMALYASFAWLGQSRGVMTVFAFTIGLLIGAEVPLLMTLIQRIRKQDAGGAVADLFAADYVGALAGGLAFPFVLLPFLGQLNGALLTGAVNAVAGAAMVLGLFRRDLSCRARGRLLLVNLAVLGVLAAAAAYAGPFERAAGQAVYGGDVRLAEQSGVQQIVLAGRETGPSLRLYLDGRLSASARDEFRYHEALVHPAMAGPHRRVLLLGGGDGLALREVLRYPDVGSVTVVELDPELVRVARTDPGLAALGHHSFADRRVRVVIADAFDWLRAPARGTYDVVISDLPAPCISRSSKLYSQEFYGLVSGVLAPDGRLVVHAGSPGEEFWTVDATVRAAGLRTADYWTWGQGFVLAGWQRPVVRLAADGPRLRSLTDWSLREAAQAAAARRTDAVPSSLMRPRYL
ncbi:polyamine aminopropyltransferase [Streptomyces sp. RB6PN25]|uniref:Polyamine aminopropyltransferase n=1 Tax=Streptomyces humicola TaxID=2953240 RepID=A0ABT1PVG6_9ACTN|nr:polyamine aminopropyltransferase [Streptomyces humicola]MCQ4081659.1 polyamine aminopropyltransferase [Streptomyces humicola]